MNRKQNVGMTQKSCLTLLLAALALPGLGQQPTAAERATLLKANIAASQSVLRQYEWIETTVVSLKGKEKSRKQERCYYGADGGLQRVETSSTPPPKKKRGLRGKIAESKQEELTDYMKSAIALVKAYVPPNPVMIQAAKDAGKISIDLLEPGRRARLNFRDYEKTGDNLGVEIDLVSNRPLSMKVATYLEDAKDAVTLAVRMGQLNDGTTYPSEVSLDAKAKKLEVAVKKSGYRKVN
jgi:hypothetical protein